MTTRLDIYNGALLVCGDRALSSLSEDREPRHLLDIVWNDNGINFCLEQAQWHFAMRATRLDYDTGVTPDWGFPRAFLKPDDWVNTSGIFEDEFLRWPLTDYADEAGYWYASRDQIYVKYVSDDAAFGGDLSRWPESFVEYVKAYFAGKIILKLTGDVARRQYLLGPPGREDRGWVNRSLMIAKNKAAMALPVTFPTRGTWARARFAGTNRRRDGGNPNSLIG